MKRLLVLAAGVLATGAPSAGAATIDVTVADDLLANDGRCSLREAVRSANLDAAPFSGLGECPAGDLVDTINLPAGSFKLAIAGNDEDTQAGDLDLLAAVTIVGAGAGATTIDADHKDRVLDIKSGSVVTLQGLTITGGKAPDGGDGPAVTDPGGSGGSATGGNGNPGQRGGGIRNAGALTMTDSAIVGNIAGSGGSGGNATAGYGAAGMPGGSGGSATGGRGGSGADGGGIYSVGSLTLVRVTVQVNHAGGGGKGGNAVGGQGGGGISDWGGASGNAFAGEGGTGGAGGGILQVGTSTQIQQSVIAGNVAGAGGNGGAASGFPGGAGYTFAGNGGLAFGGDGGAGGAGGGIVAGGGSIVRTLLSGNHAGNGGNGGNGAAPEGGPLFSATGTAGSGGDGAGGDGGAAGSAGALWTDGGTVTNVTIADNASGSGGNAGAGTGGKGGNTINAGGTLGDGGDGTGGDGGPAGDGGAILAYDPLTVAHTTITGNGLGASMPGGTGTGGTAGVGTDGAHALGPQGGALSSRAASATLAASIAAGNATPACGGAVSDGASNISPSDASCPGANVDPLLGPLGDNGGPTFTRRPGDGSPAIDGAPTQGCPATDQRGATRPHGAGCDIGAYEIAPPDVAVTAGAATVHGTVNPNARDTSYHFEYGTSTAYGSATPDANLPAGVDPVAVSAALAGLAPNTTYHLRLVASNADGSSASTDATFTTGAQVSGGDTTAPVILSASVKPKKFKRKRGTTFRYKLSESARVAFTIQRKKGKRYLKGKRFTKASKAGANKRKFTTRKLKPGRYRATLVATDAAKNRSKPKRLTFRVLR